MSKEAFEKWMKREHPGVRMDRYSDDSTYCSDNANYAWWSWCAAQSETFVADVRKFAEAAGCTTDEFNVRQTALYIGLQLEEMAEKLEGVFFSDSLTPQMRYMSDEFKSGKYDSYVECSDRLWMLDADIDLAWVTVGAALSSGADVLGAMKEVARSNFSKMVDGKMVKDANGKVIKGPDFSPPYLAPFITGDS